MSRKAIDPATYWYLNERSLYEEFEYAIITLVEESCDIMLELADKGLTFSPLSYLLMALVSGFSLPGNRKPLTTHQACWYLNKRPSYEGFEYGNLILT